MALASVSTSFGGCERVPFQIPSLPSPVPGHLLFTLHLEQQLAPKWLQAILNTSLSKYISTFRRGAPRCGAPCPNAVQRDVRNLVRRVVAEILTKNLAEIWVAVW